MPRKRSAIKVVKDSCCDMDMGKRSMCGGGYGLAFLGAAVFYIKHAVTFWGGVVGLLKAAVWPAMLMYKVLELLKMK